MKLSRLIVGTILSIILLSGCSVIKTDNSDAAIRYLAMSAVSQVTYDSLKKDYNNKIIIDQILVAIDKLDASVDMTPEEISQEIIDSITEKVDGDYQLIINGIVEAVFTKYNIGWKDTVDSAKLHQIFADIKDAINTGIDVYESKYDSSINSN